ncbi:MAG TPA: glycogen debranching enzyme N-terminal domain-containing protein, partial [Blastocatellia bacterium]|nr:glycogen debranching enzyme N-terminal domain-containing protein [Blastocatellia bacterium]
MTEPVRSIPWPVRHDESQEFEPRQEWLLTNGLGGYASGTIAGALTRRFHGILIAALPAPFGRVVMLNDMEERVRLPDGTTVLLEAEERESDGLRLNGAKYLAEFQLEWGLPVWRYEIGGITIEKRVLLPHGQNTTLVTYAMKSGDGNVRLELRPAIQFRPHEGKVDEGVHGPYELTVVEDRYELCASNTHLPPLKMALHNGNAAFTFSREIIEGLVYRVEKNRGYDYTGSLWSPGYFHVDLSEGRSATIVASTEPWEIIEALEPDEAHAAEHERRRRLIERPDLQMHEETAAELIFAADQY